MGAVARGLGQETVAPEDRAESGGLFRERHVLP